MKQLKLLIGTLKVGKITRMQGEERKHARLQALERWAKKEYEITEGKQSTFENLQESKHHQKTIHIEDSKELS